MSKKSLSGYPEPIRKDHITDYFDCGNDNLNEFLKKFAYASNQAGTSRTFVTTRDDRHIVGFYSLATGSIRKEEAPERVGKGTPNHPIPIILLARLAVDNAEQGKGFGKGLLKNALFRCFGVSKEVGIRAVLVHAKNEKAASFYKRYGFEPSPTDKFHLCLLVKDIRKSFSL